MRDTSTFVAKKLIELSFSGLLEHDILEPSAGIGFLAEEIQKHNPRCKIDCIELNKDKVVKLREKFPDAVHGDFLSLEITKKYYSIIAAPPFKGNADLQHIMQMYDLLHQSGQLVSLTSPYWLTNNEPLQVEFREWLKDKRHTMQMLPDMSFSERERTVPTAIIKIWKQ